jgi:predicted nucleic acid-binding protein
VSRSRGLLDTNVVVLRAGVDPNELPEQLAISSITLAELSVGPLVTTEPAELDRASHSSGGPTSWD